MSVLEDAIAWLAPVNCIGCEVEGATLCEACAASELLPFGERCFDCGALSGGSRTCTRCRAGAPRSVTIACEYEALARDLIRIYKFNHQRSAATAIAEVMAEALDRTIELADNLLVIPVPTASSRIRERSFDHSLLLAKALAARLGYPLSLALKRHGQARQLGSSRSLRLKQQQTTYYVPRPQTVKGRHVLLVDDVVTTGATLRAATRALKAAGVRKVDAAVFAKRLA